MVGWLKLLTQRYKRFKDLNLPGISYIVKMETIKSQQYWVGKKESRSPPHPIISQVKQQELATWVPTFEKL